MLVDWNQENAVQRSDISPAGVGVGFGKSVQAETVQTLRVLGRFVLSFSFSSVTGNYDKAHGILYEGADRLYLRLSLSSLDWHVFLL